jgi:NDP-sugar pyrophosphorylase family protein
MRRSRVTITILNDTLQRVDKYVDGDKIRNRSHAIEVLLANELKKQVIKKAVILGGGKGVDVDGVEVPKLLLPLNNKKLLIEHNIDFLKQYGINDLILSLDDNLNQIKQKLGDGSRYGIKIIYYKDSGRGNVLHQAKDLLSETFLMMNGDILLDKVDLMDMYSYHRANGGKGTVLLSTDPDPTSLGTVRLSGNRITQFIEKPPLNSTISYVINGGVYLLEHYVCQIVTTKTYSLEDYVFPLLAKDSSLYGYFSEGVWHHIHNANSYKEYLRSES